MPQMSPLLWLILYIYFILIFIIFNIMFYYFKIYKMKLDLKKKMNLINFYLKW